MNVSAKVAENIKSLCKIKDIKVYEVEEKCGVSRGYFQKQIRGNDTIPLRVVVEASSLLGVGVQDVIDKDYSVMAQKTDIERAIEEQQKMIEASKAEIASLQMQIEGLDETGN